jgi:hypothetical protein
MMMCVCVWVCGEGNVDIGLGLHIWGSHQHDDIHFVHFCVGSLRTDNSNSRCGADWSRKRYDMQIVPFCVPGFRWCDGSAKGDNVHVMLCSTHLIRGVLVYAYVCVCVWCSRKRHDMQIVPFCVAGFRWCVGNAKWGQCGCHVVRDASFPRRTRVYVCNLQCESLCIVIQKLVRGPGPHVCLIRMTTMRPGWARANDWFRLSVAWRPTFSPPRWPYVGRVFSAVWCGVSSGVCASVSVCAICFVLCALCSVLCALCSVLCAL